MERTINQNPQRYKRNDRGWVVDSRPDSPNTNGTGEIIPIDLVTELTAKDIKPVLEVDGIIVQLENSLLISKNTLEDIKKSNNPHWDYQSNGEILVKDKKVMVGKTIPIIRITDIAFPLKGAERDTINKNAGVKEVDYIYEGEKEMGIPINLIKQINYTLKEDYNRPGDTFSIWELSLGDASVYSNDELVISTLQEDGKFDKGKLNTFITEVDSRLKILNKDFEMIKGVFYSGDVPSNNGVKKFVNQVADSNSDTTFEGDSYLSTNSQVVSISPTPKDKVVDATTKVIDTLATSAQKELDTQRAQLASQEQKQTLAQQQLQADLNQQAQRTEAYYKERYGQK